MKISREMRSLNRCFYLVSSQLLIAALITLCGCSDKSRDSVRDTSNHDALSTTTVNLLRDGFENGSLAPFWLPGNYGSGLHIPGAITVTTNLSRSGTRAVQITIHEGDIAAPGDANSTVERDELDSGHFPLMGKDSWYGFSIFILKDFPIVDVRLVISSCKQSDVSRPLTAERFRNGKHTFTVESQGRKESYDLPNIPLGRWVDMICYSRFATNNDGRVQIWMDGKEVVSYKGPLADPTAKNAFYHKIGLYRDRMTQPMTIYFDNYTMGNSYQEVDPAKFDASK